MRDISKTERVKNPFEDSRGTAEICGRLIAHARAMYQAECDVSKGFEFRSRITQSVAGVLLLLAGYALFRSSSSSNEEPLLDIDLLRVSLSGELMETPWLGDFFTAMHTFAPQTYESGTWIATVSIVAIALSPTIFGILVILAALANEFRHGEDEFFFEEAADQKEFNSFPKPQRTWKQVSLFWGIGEAIDIGRKVVLPSPLGKYGNRNATKRGLDPYLDIVRFNASQAIGDAQNNTWYTPRPRMERFRTGSFYLQFPGLSCKQMYTFLTTHSPIDAEIFRSSYTAAQNQRRWNQRRVDELRTSERLLVQGLFLTAISLILFVNLLLAQIPNYPALFIFVVGCLFASSAMIYKQTVRTWWDRKIQSQWKNMTSPPDQPNNKDGQGEPEKPIKAGTESKLYETKQCTTTLNDQKSLLSIDYNDDNNRFVWCDIPVDNLDRACAFYEGVMGIKCHRESFGDVQFAVFEHHERNGGCLVPRREGQGTSGPLVYLNVNGRIRDAAKKATELGGKVIQDVHAIGPHGCRALIEDSEGNAMALHSRIDVSVASTIHSVSTEQQTS